jgi:hypothetical protein
MPTMTYLWCYWENRYSSAKPAYLRMCEQTIRRHKGTAEFIVVTPETLAKYVPTLPRGYDALVPAHRSDYLRLRLLHDHGGAWIDADTVAFDDLTANFLTLLDEAPVISIGTGALAQAMFGSRAKGAFITECLEEATRRIEGAQPLSWGAIGSALLLPVAEKHGYRKVEKQAWAYGYKDWQKYLEPGTIDMSNRLICMLYNKMMFDTLKEKSEADILSADTRLAWMFKTALA